MSTRGARFCSSEDTGATDEIRPSRVFQTCLGQKDREMVREREEGGRREERDEERGREEKW